MLALVGMEDPERVCPKCGTSYPSEVLFCPKDGSPLTLPGKTEIEQDPYLGLHVADQFRIEQLIGIGAMGRVYRAYQEGIERQVAIKILHRDLLRNPTVSSRFCREAKVASRLTHPNVVQVLMVGELERLNVDVGGEAYLVMEYLDGISLRSALGAAGGALALPRSLHVLLQVCDAVGEAHAQGIVHRDLKPENVMLVRRGDDNDFAKVLDFGVARLEWTEGTAATQAGVIFGTARYISPEGARGDGVAAPGDVYSLTTLLYHCLAGRTPFDGDSPVAILIKHTTLPAPDVRSWPRSSYVPEPLARLIARNLSKDPAERCTNGRELGRALVEAARESGLRPADLVVRSTLLGDRPEAVSLESLQRTRTLDLSPELAQRLAVESTPGHTRMLESNGRGALGTEQPKGASAPNPDLAPKSTPHATGDAPGQLRDSRMNGRVEPTMADEPATDLFRGSAARSPVAAGGTVDGPRAPESSSPRFMDANWEPSSEQPSAGPSRSVLVVACFALGALVALIVAFRLGVFEPREPSLDSYTERARNALAAKAWDRPALENVREITDAALRRWPNARSIVEIRKRAAESLLKEAQALGSEQREQAARLANLATEFDPSNEAVRRLVNVLETPPPGPEAGWGPASPSSPPPARPSQPAAAKPGGARPTPAPPSSVSPDPEPPPGATPSAGAGRWL
jgi:serine/threonine protein kinase